MPYSHIYQIRAGRYYTLCDDTCNQAVEMCYIALCECTAIMWKELDILYVHIFLSLCMIHESACLDYLANIHCWSHFPPCLSQDTDEKSHLYIGQKPVLLLLVLHWRSKLGRVHPSCCSVLNFQLGKLFQKLKRNCDQLGRLMNSLNIFHCMRCTSRAVKSIWT